MDKGFKMEESLRRNEDDEGTDPGSEHGDGEIIPNSTLQEKINIVQKILTILETTMSSAKTGHQKKLMDYAQRITDLKLEIEKLERKMDVEDNSFRVSSKALENNIHKYIASENKLMTVEENCDFDYVILPDLDPENDYLIEQYMEGGINEWRMIRRQCKNLNHNTQKTFNKDVLVRRFKVVVPLSAGEAVRKAAVAANALNMFRGKNFVDRNSVSQVEHFITMTCYKNEDAAVQYMSSNYTEIITQVFRKEYVNVDNLAIDELATSNGDEFNPSTMMERTIHVQGKTKSALSTPNMPRKITVYQFDEDARRHFGQPLSQLTTFSVETSSVVSQGSSTEDISSTILSPSDRPPPSNPEMENKSQTQHITPTSSAVRTNPQSKIAAKRMASKKTSKLLSSLGIHLGDNSEYMVANPNISTGIQISAQARPCQSNNHRVAAAKGTSSVVWLPPNSQDIKQLDGVEIREWVWCLTRSKGIQFLTETQKELFASFKKNGDIIYKGISNSGKTFGMIMGILNELDADVFKPQVLVISQSKRSLKLIQKDATVHADNYMIFCKSYNDIYGTDKDKLHKPKTTKYPPCQVLVGSAMEMHEMVTNGFVKTEFVKILVLHKLEEVIGPESIRKEVFNRINKILYTLSATIKVIVVCKSTTRVCPEMQQLCNSKLRNKIVLEETTDLEEFLHDRVRRRSGETNAIKDDLNPLMLPGSSILTRKGNSSDSGTTVSPTTADETLVSETYESLMRPGPSWRDETSSVSKSGTKSTKKRKSVDNDSSADEEDAGACSFIPYEAAKLLGMFVQPLDDESPASNEVELAHFYATIEDGSDENKAQVISMLDLERDKAIIFCNSAEKTEWLSTSLRCLNLWPHVLHEGLETDELRVILENYREGSICRLLICTDFLLSISLDSADVVLNFDMPESAHVYFARAAYAYREVNSGKSSKRDVPVGDDNKGMVVSLIADDQIATIEKLQQTLGIFIHNCEG